MPARTVSSLPASAVSMSVWAMPTTEAQSILAAAGSSTSPPPPPPPPPPPTTSTPTPPPLGRLLCLGQQLLHLAGLVGRVDLHAGIDLDRVDERDPGAI